ncbi:MAG: hypothetical protein EOO92_05285 [Pedobacter sp.]|nr:MAG: hypothetical protein EOO92_05285 [Pedobacter sp.]
MRFAYSLKQKTKIAVLLFCIMACTILIRLLEDRSIQDLNKSFVSLYNDRLIPATDLFYLSEHIHAKSVILRNADLNTDKIRHQVLLLHHNRAIDSLIVKYEKTYLVSQEKQHLATLKKSLLTNTQSEGQALRNLTELMQIQTQVGQELIKDSEFAVSGSKLYSTLQLILAIIIGILIVGILFTSSVVKISSEKFNLN